MKRSEADAEFAPQVESLVNLQLAICQSFTNLREVLLRRMTLQCAMLMMMDMDNEHASVAAKGW